MNYRFKTYLMPTIIRKSTPCTMCNYCPMILHTISSVIVCDIMYAFDQFINMGLISAMIHLFQIQNIWHAKNCLVSQGMDGLAFLREVWNLAINVKADFRFALGQPDGVTKKRRVSVAGCKPRISPKPAAPTSCTADGRSPFWWWYILSSGIPIRWLATVYCAFRYRDTQK